MLRKSLILSALLVAFVIFQPAAVNAQTTEAKESKLSRLLDLVERGVTAIGAAELIKEGYETAKEFFSSNSEPPETVKPEPPERPERPYRGGYEPD